MHYTLSWLAVLPSDTTRGMGSACSEDFLVVTRELLLTATMSAAQDVYGLSHQQQQQHRQQPPTTPASAAADMEGSHAGSATAAAEGNARLVGTRVGLQCPEALQCLSIMTALAAFKPLHAPIKASGGTSSRREEARLSAALSQLPDSYGRLAKLLGFSDRVMFKAASLISHVGGVRPSDSNARALAAIAFRVQEFARQDELQLQQRLRKLAFYQEQRWAGVQQQLLQPLQLQLPPELQLLLAVVYLQYAASLQQSAQYHLVSVLVLVQATCRLVRIYFCAWHEASLLSEAAVALRAARQPSQTAADINAAAAVVVVVVVTPVAPVHNVTGEAGQGSRDAETLAALAHATPAASAATDSSDKQNPGPPPAAEADVGAASGGSLNAWEALQDPDTTEEEEAGMTLDPVLLPELLPALQQLMTVLLPLRQSSESSSSSSSSSSNSHPAQQAHASSSSAQSNLGSCFVAVGDMLVLLLRYEVGHQFVASNNSSAMSSDTTSSTVVVTPDSGAEPLGCSTTGSSSSQRPDGIPHPEYPLFLQLLSLLEAYVRAQAAGPLAGLQAGFIAENCLQRLPAYLGMRAFGWVLPVHGEPDVVPSDNPVQLQLLTLLCSMLKFSKVCYTAAGVGGAGGNSVLAEMAKAYWASAHCPVGMLLATWGTLEKGGAVAGTTNPCDAEHPSPAAADVDNAAALLTMPMEQPAPLGAQLTVQQHAACEVTWQGVDTGTNSQAGGTSQSEAPGVCQWLMLFGRCCLLLSQGIAQSSVQLKPAKSTGMGQMVAAMTPALHVCCKRLQGSPLCQRLAAGGFDLESLLQLLQGAAAVLHAAVSESGQGEDWGPEVSAQVAQQLAAVGIALSVLPTPHTCNNPACTNISGPSEAQLVKSCKCAGCLVAHYCGKACQRQHWKQHKPVCKALAATAQSHKATAS